MTKKLMGCPAWLGLSEDRTSFVFMPERAKIVRRIFELSIAGFGGHNIAKQLNEKNVEEKIFKAAQEARQRNLAPGRGRKGRLITNVFSGLPTCSYCRRLTRNAVTGPLSLTASAIRPNTNVDDRLCLRQPAGGKKDPASCPTGLGHDAITTVIALKAGYQPGRA
jgi:hypothetical protein